MDIAPVIVAYFIPLGILLIAWGSWDHERARDHAGLALLVVAVAVMAYVVIGFGLNFGGVGLRPDVPGGLRALDRMWSPIVGNAGRNWGVVGLTGFMLNAQSIFPGDTALIATQFIHHLPIVMAAALIPALTLAGRVRTIGVTIIVVFVAALIVPVLGAWTWGGGWLFALGHDAKFGHGLIDAGGAATAFTTAGAISFALLLALRIQRTSSSINTTSIELPLRSAFGAIVFVIGWLAWLTTDPILRALTTIDLALAATNLLLSGAAAAILAAAYSWFTMGKPSAQFAARGAISGVVAAAAGAPFVPTGGALIIGVIAGLWTPIGLYLIERRLRLDDAAGFVASTGLAGVWSIIAVGLLADGTYGAGWNNIGVVEYLSVSGQGITGLWAGANLQNDPGQMSAQLTGALVIVLVAFALTWLLARPFRRTVSHARSTDALIEARAIRTDS